MKKTRKSNSKKPTFEPDVIEKDLCKLFPKEWLRNAAKETGLIKRERKIEAFVMLWTLVFSFGAHLPRNLAKIKENEGYFVSRLKGSADPLIIDVYNACPGNSIDVKGKYLSEILPKLKRQVLDVEVEISFQETEL